MASNQRVVQVRVVTPKVRCPAATAIVFSHGAFSTFDRYDVLIENWAKMGYLVAAPMHVDSEEHSNSAAYKGNTVTETRIEDYAVTADYILSSEIRPNLSCTPPEKIVVAGHSYGALIAQVAGGAALSKQAKINKPAKMIDPIGVLAISPPGAIPNLIEASGWAQIRKPMLVVTGTNDVVSSFIPDWKMHLHSYQAVRESRAYSLIFQDIDHYFNGAFGRISESGPGSYSEISALNAAISSLLKHWDNGRELKSETWLARSDNQLEAGLK